MPSLPCYHGSCSPTSLFSRCAVCIPNVSTGRRRALLTTFSSLTPFLPIRCAHLFSQQGGYTPLTISTFPYALPSPACRAEALAKAGLCFHILTNCFFRNPFLLIFIQIGGGWGAHPSSQTPLFLRSGRSCSRQAKPKENCDNGEERSGGIEQGIVRRSDTAGDEGLVDFVEDGIAGGYGKGG
jgi:hypothetical protein